MYHRELGPKTKRGLKPREDTPNSCHVYDPDGCDLHGGQGRPALQDRILGLPDDLILETKVTAYLEEVDGLPARKMISRSDHHGIPARRVQSGCVADSALACWTTGRSGSASFHRSMRSR